jgi:recombination protein RecA
MAKVAARAAIESLLRARQLDRTLTSVAPWHTSRHDDDPASTGVPSLDAMLAGGFRRGHLSELVGPRSSGRTTVMCQVLASAAARGEAVALVDTCDRFDPASAEASGLDLSKLLWIRETGDAPRALKAAMLVLQAGGFGVVVFDLADVRVTALREFPFTTWLRLARVIEGSATVALLVGSQHLGRSPGGVTVTFEPMPGLSRARWAGASHRARLFDGVELRARMVGGQCESRPTTI